MSDVWGTQAQQREQLCSGEGTRWLDSVDVLQDYVFPQFGRRDWYQYVADHWCREPRALGLSLCCGDGGVERNLLRFGICVSCEGIDISEEAVRLCQEKAAAEGLANRLSYWAADIEAANLGRGRYDAVIAWMALHHVRRLRRVFEKVRRALKPDGIFIVNEYVGPVRFQLPRKQVELINSLLANVPEDLRREAGGDIKQRFLRPRLADIVDRDPSEAVHSDRIVPLLRRSFTVVDCVEYGGTVLNWLLDSIVQNFQLEDPAHRAVLERLYEAERSALASGEFSSDFTFVVARPR